LQRKAFGASGEVPILALGLWSYTPNVEVGAFWEVHIQDPA
jgi:hypothetical protein